MAEPARPRRHREPSGRPLGRSGRSDRDGRGIPLWSGSEYGGGRL